MEEKIVFKGKLNHGTEYYLRYPKAADLRILLDYINTLSSEKTFILYQGEQLTLAEEKVFLDNQLKGIKEKRTVMLLLFVNEKLAGDSAITQKPLYAGKHVGLFGISIAKEFRHQGLGKILMQKTLEEGLRALPDLETVVLGCFANNTVAINMYKEFGFKEYGRLEDAIKYKGEYIADIKMYKKIR